MTYRIETVKAWMRTWSAVVVLLFLSAPRIFSAIITVTSTADSGPGSLPAAIASAANGDLINFNLPYPATIVVSTPLTLTSSVTIAGPGIGNLAISGGNSVGVIVVNAGVTAAISGVSIQFGSSLLGGGISNVGTLTLTNCLIADNGQGTQLGGGIFNAGTLTLTSSTVAENQAGFGVASVSGETGLGGGIYNYGEAGGGTLTLTDSTVFANTVNQGLTGYPSGGGIYNDRGQVTLTNSLVFANIAEGTLNGLGGGIYNSGGSLTLTNSTIRDSHAAGGGGGIYINSGTVTVTQSTIWGNSSISSGGGSIGGGAGGGIYLNSGTVTVINSTFAQNSAVNEGGGIESVADADSAAGGVLTVTFSTFWGNTAALGAGINAYGLTTVKNSILANNPGGNCESLSQPDWSDGHNLSDDTTCFFAGPGDLNNTPAGLDPGGLNNNGGPTLTVALLATSAAVNAIPVSACTDVNGNPVTTDQRGVPRPQGSGCDIGAFEYFHSLYVVPAVQTFLLIDAVQTSTLPLVAKMALKTPLQAAVDSLNLGVVQAAKGQLGAFINLVDQSRLASGLSQEEAAAWTSSATAIIHSIGST